MCNFLFGMQTRNRISLHHAKNADIMSVRWWIVRWWIVKNIISQSDRSTGVTCNVAPPVKNDRELMPMDFIVVLPWQELKLPGRSSHRSHRSH